MMNQPAPTLLIILPTLPGGVGLFLLAGSGTAAGSQVYEEAERRPEAS